METQKHAYLIGAYHNYEVLKYCLQLLDHPLNDIFLHIDQKETAAFPQKDFKKLLRYSQIYYVPSLNVIWAHSSQIALVLHLMEQAVQMGPYAYYHFFQGADLPIKRPETIHAWFAAHNGLEFIDFTFGDPHMADYKANYYHLFVGMKRYRYSRFLKLLNHGFAHLQRFLHIKRSNAPLFYGSALFSITHAYACDLLSRKDALLKRYRFTLACDEIFLQTDVMQSAFRDKLAFPQKPFLSNARYIDWEQRAGNSPHTFTVLDCSRLLSCPEGICFARKFDETVDLEVVKQIYEALTNLPV